MKRAILSAFAIAALVTSVAEAKLETFCGMMSLGTSGNGKLTTYTLVDESAAGKKFFNPDIPQDFEEGVMFSPKPGDSDPNSPSYVDHNVRVGGENIWMNDANGMLDNPELKHKSCLCVYGVLEKRNGLNVLGLVEGYAFRPAASCKGISEAAVKKYSGHRN